MRESKYGFMYYDDLPGDYRLCAGISDFLSYFVRLDYALRYGYEVRAGREYLIKNGYGKYEYYKSNPFTFWDKYLAEYLLENRLYVKIKK